MELKEMIKIMQHYETGGEVELKEKDKDDAEWEIRDPLWNWRNFDYRIRAVKQEVTIEKWLCSDDQGDFVVIEASNVKVYIYYKKIKLLESYKIEL